MLAALLAIVRNTFYETVRQPVYGVLLWIGLFWVGFVAPALAAFTLESGGDKKMMWDVSIASMMLYGLLCAVFSATSVITREIESHTVLTVVSKPVSRPTFVIGKYLGVCGAVLSGYFLLTVALFMTTRHGTMETVSDEWDQPVLVFSSLAVLISLVAATFGNYVYGWHFSSTLTYWLLPLGGLALLGILVLGPKWALQSPATDFGNMQLVSAAALAFCAVLMLTAFAVTLATRFSQVGTLLLCVGVYFGGLLTDYAFGRHADAGWLQTLAYHALPNFQFFWIADAMTQDLTVTAGHVVNVIAYTFCYVLAVLCLGIALFQTREVS